jgi:ABC-type lipoprotein release transport system permease subunit
MKTLALLIKLAWRNLWRRRLRTALILFALALGVWSMISLAALMRGSMEQQVEKAVLNLLGHVQVHASGYRDDPVIEHRMPAPSADLRASLDGPGILRWSSRLRVPAVVSSERESAAVTLVAIEPERERGLSFIPSAVKQGRYLDSLDDNGIVIGRKLAERLETALGRRIVLMTQDIDNQIADRGFRVVGIFDAQPESTETGYVFVARGTAQNFLKLGDAITEITLITQDRKLLDVPLARLRATVPELDVQPWSVIEPLLAVTETITDAFLIIWYVVIFTAMSFGLVNTLLMAVFERTREFGLFQALGMPPRHILGQVFVESLILLCLALAIGNLAAFATIEMLEDGIDLSAFAQGLEMVGISPVLYPLVTVGDVTAANALVFVLGVVASLYPAWRAARYVPVEAITRT